MNHENFKFTMCMNFIIPDLVYFNDKFIILEFKINIR